MNQSVLINTWRLLETASGITINTFDDYLAALKNRHDYFAANHCSVSDHGWKRSMQKIILNQRSWYF